MCTRIGGHCRWSLRESRLHVSSGRKFRLRLMFCVESRRGATGGVNPGGRRPGPNHRFDKPGLLMSCGEEGIQWCVRIRSVRVFRNSCRSVFPGLSVVDTPVALTAGSVDSRHDDPLFPSISMNTGSVMIRVSKQPFRPVPGFAFGSTSGASVLPSFDSQLIRAAVSQTPRRSTLPGCFLGRCTSTQLHNFQQRFKDFHIVRCDTEQNWMSPADDDTAPSDLRMDAPVSDAETALQETGEIAADNDCHLNRQVPESCEFDLRIYVP